MRSTISRRLMWMVAWSFAASGGAGAKDDRLLTGHAAFGDWHADRPGLRRRITPDDLPPPYATHPTANIARPAEPPVGGLPKVPSGFQVTRFASGLDGPRLLRVAPNGDVFVAETSAGNIRVLRPSADGLSTTETSVFAGALDGPFGLAFFPPGSTPQWLYVATNNAVLRFSYRTGDMVARSAPETIVAKIAATTGGHTTRDLAFSADGKHMFVSVGSSSNVADEMSPRPPGDGQAWISGHATGASWDADDGRAALLQFDVDGSKRRVYATGIRNCVTVAIDPATHAPWCATNERDMLGDDLVPDYVTSVQDGGFYGWPWFYIGDHEDPRKKGQRQDLKGKVAMPDVLIQPHSAPLQMTFYTPGPAATAAFPANYRGDIFVALHGSWNRQKRTGYKLVRIHSKDGDTQGVYEDFMTGFVLDDDRVWGRPVGVAVAADGALLVSQDDNGIIWRIAPVDGNR